MEGFVAADGGGFPGINNIGDVPVPSFTREQKQQIKQYADTVLGVLDEIEDKVWDVDEGQVADVMKVALGKCCEALDNLKERLPRNDAQRRELARGCVTGIMDPTPGSAHHAFREGTRGSAANANAYAEPESVDEEMVLAAAMLPENQREQFMQTMEAARAGLRARMQREWTQETRCHAEQELVDRMLLMEAVLDEIRDVMASVDDDDLEQMSFFGVAFARYVATTARSAVDSAVGMVFDDEESVVVDASSRFQELDADGEEIQKSGHGSGEAAQGASREESKGAASHRRASGNTDIPPKLNHPLRSAPPCAGGRRWDGAPEEGGARQNRRSVRRKCARVRLLWPSIRRCCLQPSLEQIRKKFLLVRSAVLAIDSKARGGPAGMCSRVCCWNRVLIAWLTLAILD
jgi:hypothetical protein